SRSPPATAPWSVIRQSRFGNVGGWIRLAMVASVAQGSLAVSSVVAVAVGSATRAVRDGGAEQLPSAVSIRQPGTEKRLMSSIEQWGQRLPMTACTRPWRGSVYFLCWQANERCSLQL